MCLTRIKCHFGLHPKDETVLEDASRLSESRFAYSGTCRLCGKHTTKLGGFPRNVFHVPGKPLTFGDVI